MPKTREELAACREVVAVAIRADARKALDALLMEWKEGYRGLPKGATEATMTGVASKKVLRWLEDLREADRLSDLDAYEVERAWLVETRVRSTVESLVTAVEAKAEAAGLAVSLAAAPTAA